MTTLTAPAPAVKPTSVPLEIRGQLYSATPIASNCPDIIAAWRVLNLRNGNVYDLAVSDQTGVSCDCPDAEFRHRDAGTLCKHARECIRAGLFDAAEIALDSAGVVVGVRRSRSKVAAPARTPAKDAARDRAFGTRTAPISPGSQGLKPAPCCAPAEPAPCAGCEPIKPGSQVLKSDPEPMAVDAHGWPLDCEAEPTEAELLECLADRPDPVAEAWNDGYRAALLAYGLLN